VIKSPPIESPPIESPPIESPPIELPVIDVSSAQPPVIKVPSVQPPVTDVPPVEPVMIKVPPVDTHPTKTPNIDARKPSVVSGGPPVPARPSVRYGDDIAWEQAWVVKPASEVFAKYAIIFVFGVFGAWLVFS
jgi:hypothetical protein